MSKERILKSVIGQNTGKTREDEGFADSFDTNICPYKACNGSGIIRKEQDGALWLSSVSVITVRY